MDPHRLQLVLDLSPDDDARHSSVAVLVYGAKPSILMTKKSARLRNHAGEIAFPGGRPEPADADLLDTAIREVCEELGIVLTREMVSCSLAPVHTQSSNFVILPYVFVLDSVPGHVVPNSEVESVLRIPLYPLLRTRVRDRSGYAFGFEGHRIWGASARILDQLCALSV